MTVFYNELAITVALAFIRLCSLLAKTELLAQDAKSVNKGDRRSAIETIALVGRSSLWILIFVNITI